MSKTKYISFIAVSFLIITSVFLASKASAQEATGTASIQYPIKELGNCQDKAACSAYCDKPENTDACLSFAEKNNMMSKDEVDMAKKFVASGQTGPGGCKTKDACEAYCNDISHIDECVSFAEKNNLMPPKDLEEAKKVQKAIASGVKPPPCGNKQACDAYCEEPDHMEECITFGVAAGFMQGKELENAQKMLVALKRGVKPLPCKGKEACDAYCNNPDNMESCINFAIEAGFMNYQEKADSQKMLAALKKGVKPLPCKGKEACDAYCSQDEHLEECINFSEAAGFMSPQDAAMARKTGGKGPGGCKGKDECDAFCNNPDNQETCFNFAKDNGMIPEADLKQMEEGKQKFKESLDQAPPAVIDCLNSQLGTDMVEKFKSGSAMPPKNMGDKMQTCFQLIGPSPQGEPGAGGMIPPVGQTGPGGCQTQEECKAYCEKNPQECQNFMPEGQQPPQPPAGENPQQNPPNFQPPPGNQQFPAGQMPPNGQQSPNFQQPPANQQPPSGSPPPPPSGSLTPGSLIDIFNKILHH